MHQLGRILAIRCSHSWYLMGIPLCRFTFGIFFIWSNCYYLGCRCRIQKTLITGIFLFLRSLIEFYISGSFLFLPLLVWTSFKKDFVKNAALNASLIPFPIRSGAFIIIHNIGRNFCSETKLKHILPWFCNFAVNSTNQISSVLIFQYFFNMRLAPFYTGSSWLGKWLWY